MKNSSKGAFLRAVLHGVISRMLEESQSGRHFATVSVTSTRIISLLMGSAAFVNWVVCPLFSATESDMADHHSVYVVYLSESEGRRPGGLLCGHDRVDAGRAIQEPQERREVRARRQKYGVRLVPKLYAHLNPMPLPRRPFKWKRSWPRAYGNAVMKCPGGH